MNFIEQFSITQNQAKNLSNVYHYTDLKTLDMILSNQSILFNRIDKVNDLLEHKRIDDFSKRKGFVSCFSCREHESYFFWKVYSQKQKDSIGVRIKFPRELLNSREFYFDAECTNLIPFIDKTDTTHKQYGTENDWGISNCYVSKMIYANELKDYCYTDEWKKETFKDCVNLKGESFEYNALECFVKTKEWDSEEEIRIAVFVRPKGMETKLGKTIFHSNTYYQPFFERIFLKIPIELLNRCDFVLSPLNNDKFDKFTKTIRKFESTKNCILSRSMMSTQ